jgi:hypothetical protein
LIVIVVEELPKGLHADAGTVYVTVYVPAVLDPRLITPVEALMLKPAVELNVPPGVNDGGTIAVGFAPSLQTGEAMEKVVTGTPTGIAVTLKVSFIAQPLV